MRRRFLSCLFFVAVAFSLTPFPAPGAPLTDAPVWFAEGLDFGGRFGASVAAAGDVDNDGHTDLIVGAPLAGAAEEGRVLLYLGSANGLESTPAWSVRGGLAGAHLGASVAPAGDVNGDGYDDVIIGAPGYEDGPPNEGEALLYLGSPSGLAPEPVWVAKGRQAGAGFGASVGGAGDLNGDGFDDVVVGAPGAYADQAEEGRAYVYLGKLSGLSDQAVWTSGGHETGAAQGASVAGAGDVNADGYADLLVGAPGTGAGGTSIGRAGLYLGGPGGPAVTDSWSASGAQAGGLFGASVAGIGDLNGDGYADIAIGAPGQDGDAADAGAVFVYFGSASGPSASAGWTRLGESAGGRLGTSVSAAGDIDGDGFADLLAGAPRENNGESASGEACLFLGAASGPGSVPAWSAAGEVDPSEFGNSVCSAGDFNGDGFGDVVVGAWKHSGGRGEEGAAFAFGGSARPASLHPAWTQDCPLDGAFMGFAMSSAGDVNGDGYGDLLVSAPFYWEPAWAVGRVWLYHGGPAGIGSTPAWDHSGAVDYAYFGYSMGSAGDVNGDGFGDVVISSYYKDGSGNGRVFVYAGSPAGIPSSPNWTITGPQYGDEYGYSVASAGDINGDGYGDIVVGAMAYDHPLADEGAAFLYLGSRNGLSVTPSWTVEGDQTGAEMGWSVASAGDVNGDGFSDVIVGAERYDHGTDNDAGAAFLYLGGSSGLHPVPDWTAYGEMGGSLFGNTVASAGDINGDGFSDVVVTAPALGYVYVFEGSPSGLGADPAWGVDIRPSQMGWTFDTNAAAAGDVNGDGFGDLLIGDPWLTGGGSRGRAHVFLGSVSGLGEEPWWTGAASSQGLFGHLVASAGDVNGDGWGDIAVGDPWADQYPPGNGRAYLYLGNGGGGLPRTPGAWTVGGASPIALRGPSDSPYSFRVKAIGRTPAGRGRVRLDIEVKPLGVPFDGIAIRSGSSWRTGTPQGSLGSNVSLDELLPAELQPSTPYHWRARLASDAPFFPRTPWFSPQGNSPSEIDLRTRGAQAAEAGEGAGASPLLALDPVSPNPFTDRLCVDYTLQRDGPVRVTLIDPVGRCVAVFDAGLRMSGHHRIVWNGVDRGAETASGIYLVRIEALGETRAVKVARRR
jgi:hypothetical protein